MLGYALDMKKPAKHVFVCLHDRPAKVPKGSCAGRGSEVLFDALRAAVKSAGLWGGIRVTKTGCLGPCAAGANVVVYPEGVWYHAVTEADAEQIVTDHLVAGKPVTRLQR